MYLNNDNTIRLLGNKKNLWQTRTDPEAEGQKGKIKLDKIEKMKSVLRKQGLIVNEENKEDAIEPNEQKPAKPIVGG